jgi:hypothetical protein
MRIKTKSSYTRTIEALKLSLESSRKIQRENTKKRISEKHYGLMAFIKKQNFLHPFLSLIAFAVVILGFTFIFGYSFNRLAIRTDGPQDIKIQLTGVLIFIGCIFLLSLGYLFVVIVVPEEDDYDARWKTILENFLEESGICQSIDGRHEQYSVAKSKLGVVIRGCDYFGWFTKGFTLIVTGLFTRSEFIKSIFNMTLENSKIETFFVVSYTVFMFFIFGNISS